MAFTRLDLAIAMATLALLGLVSLPTAAGTRPRGERFVCLNNLRQLGQAWNTWAADHGNLYPWRLSPANGGTQFHPLVDNAWLHYSYLSNVLATPRVLTCPSDVSRRVASDFSSSPNGGFLSGGIRNDCLSYFICLDCWPELPQHWLAGDRNIRAVGNSGTCSTGVKMPVTIYVNRASETVSYPSDTGWTNTLHGTSGNVLHTDGRVEELSSDGFRKSVVYADDNNTVHFLIP